jgi:hypothetical protein
MGRRRCLEARPGADDLGALPTICGDGRLTGFLLLAAATIGVLATAVLVVSTLRLRSTISCVLGVLTVGWALLVVETMLLSFARSWTKGWLLAAVYVGLALALAAWHKTGRPRPPASTPVLRATREARRDPVLRVLFLANLDAGAYVVVVALAIPPLDIDVIAYHLPRIVLWMQQHAVGAIPNSPGSNLESNPPSAEIAQGTTLLLAGTDRYAALFQVVCLPVGALAVGGIARRLGLDLRAALFGALLYAAFPIVALQAPTALNDLAVATALVVACCFALGETRAELALAAVTVALAVTAKLSGILGIPSILLLALVAVPAGRRLRVVAAVAAGCLAAASWYLFNLVHTGAWDGHLGSDYGQVPSRAPGEIVRRLEQYSLQTLDLAGVVGRDRYVFPVVAGLLVLAALLAWRACSRRAAGFVAAAALVAAAPWLIDWAHVAAVRVVARSWIATGHRDAIADLPMHAVAGPLPGETWFGPTLAIVLVAATIIVWRRTAGRRRVVLFTALLSAPALLYLVNASAFVYDGARGRFFILAGALAASALGVVVRVRPVAWATATIAVVTLALSFVHYHARPLGIRLFQPIDESTLWGEPRWRAQTVLAPSPEATRTAQILDGLPARAVVTVEAQRFAWLYPLMGPGPWRSIRLVRPGGPIPLASHYLAIDPATHVHPDPAVWRRVPGVTIWRLYERRAESP